LSFQCERATLNTNMNQQILEETARALVSRGKGILAADESSGTIEKRFKSIGVESNEDTRRAYRELLFTTPNMEEYVSGVILFDETIRTNASDGNNFARILEGKGVIPGIKVDKGTVSMAESPEEKITEGLDGLRERLEEYKNFGARFTKWRAVITIGDTIPTDTCIEANAEDLARYAAQAQELDLVPIVEPEVLMDGQHDLDTCRKVTYRTLKSVFMKLSDHNVLLSGMLLKPNMVVPGKESGQELDPKKVAEATVQMFKEVVPAEVAGVVFLSGGMSSQEASACLNEMNKLENLPWQLSFSYGRALQEDALKTWTGVEGNKEKAQKVFLHRAKMNSLARSGKYSSDMEDDIHV
jgi:fructose-bisphosphate aldolase, class I